MTSMLISLLWTLRGLAQSRAALHLEVLALRHQSQALQRSRPRQLRLVQADRWLWVALSRVWTAWRTALVIVKPETVICLAPPRLPILLDVEEPSTHRSTDRTGRPARADPNDVADKPTLGRASDPRRIAQTGD